MLWKKRKSEEILPEDILLNEDELEDDEFFMAEEIDGYCNCIGMNAQKCSSECFKAVMVPTITVIS